jgi:hypothetical protein
MAELVRLMAVDREPVAPASVEPRELVGNGAGGRG